MSHSIPNKYEHVHLHTYTLNVFAENEYNKEKIKIFNKDENVFQKSDFTTKIISTIGSFHKIYNKKIKSAYARNHKKHRKL